MKFPFVRSLLATLFLAAGVAHAADDDGQEKPRELPQRPAVESVKKTPTAGCSKSC
jgi:hypothetical protein